MPDIPRFNAGQPRHVVVGGNQAPKNSWPMLTAAGQGLGPQARDPCFSVQLLAGLQHRQFGRRRLE